MVVGCLLHQLLFLLLISIQNAKYNINGTETSPSLTKVQMDFKVCPSWHSGINSSPSTVFYRQKGLMKRRLNYYLNCSASFNPITAIRRGAIHPHPGPVSHSASTSTRKQTPHSFCPEIKCLYMNPRSLVNKSAEFQSLAADLDLIDVTETWLKPHILDCEILPGLDFSIHRRDRKDKTGGGVMLAVKNSIQTLRRKDLEGDAEIVLCELRPEARRKILAVVFYRPPNSNLDHLKELKKSLRVRHASQFNLDQIIICGDFNLPDIDWSTSIASSSESLHNYFTKFVKDNYLWQLVHFPTRNNNILDLILTNIPDKIHNLHGYDDIISTDHKLIGFDLDLTVPKEPDIKRYVYDFKRADWSSLNNSLQNTSWDQCFVPNDVDGTLSNWCAVFLTIVNQHVPKSKTRNIHDHPWIDKEILSLIKRKNKQSLKANRTGCVHDAQKFKDLRRLTKQLISQKKKEYATKLRDSVTENPKSFWSFVKSSRSVKITANLFRDNQSFITDSRDKANLLNSFFHSVFIPAQATTTTPNLPLSSDKALSNIQLTENEVFKAPDGLDPSKACGSDGIPGKLLKMTANTIAPSLCQIYNLSLSQGVVPACWKLANVTPVFKKDDRTLASNYRPISLLSIISKTFERCVYNHCYPHISRRFYHLQHGFLRGKSTVTQLLHVYQEILDHLAGGKEVDAIHLDLSKAFDRVQHPGPSPGNFSGGCIKVILTD